MFHFYSRIQGNLLTTVKGRMNSSDGQETEKQNVIRTYSGTVINVKKDVWMWTAPGNVMEKAQVNYL